MRERRKFLCLAASLLVSPAVAPAVFADSKHDRLRQAVERGEVRSLATILASIKEKLPGEVTGIEAEQKKGRWFYELIVVDPKGKLFEVYVDAQSGEIERIKVK